MATERRDRFDAGTLLIATERLVESTSKLEKAVSELASRPLGVSSVAVNTGGIATLLCATMCALAFGVVMAMAMVSVSKDAAQDRKIDDITRYLQAIHPHAPHLENPNGNDHHNQPPAE